MYERYKKELSKKEYFKKWDLDTLKTLNEKQKQEIYDRYLMKCKVFKKANYTCQNKLCKGHGSKLTLHHIKLKKNGGEDTEDNGAALCNTCHAAYHKYKAPVKIGKITYEMTRPSKTDWKKIRKDMKTLRKDNKNKRVHIEWDYIAILIKFLFTDYSRKASVV